MKNERIFKKGAALLITVFFTCMVFLPTFSAHIQTKQERFTDLSEEELQSYFDQVVQYPPVRYDTNYYPEQPAFECRRGTGDQPPRLFEDATKRLARLSVQRYRRSTCSDRPTPSCLGNGRDGGERNRHLRQLALGA